MLADTSIPGRHSLEARDAGRARQKGSGIAGGFPTAVALSTVRSGEYGGDRPASRTSCANEFWLPPGSRWEDRLASEPGPGQLNPLNPETYRVVGNVLRDAAELFPELFLHLGADEDTNLI